MSAQPIRCPAKRDPGAQPDKATAEAGGLRFSGFGFHVFRGDYSAATTGMVGASSQPRIRGRLDMKHHGSAGEGVRNNAVLKDLLS